MIAFILAALFTSAVFIAIFIIAEPAVVPWGERGKAARRIAAMWKWSLYLRAPGMSNLHARAEGYFVVRDYIGVESAYLEARRIVDGEGAP